MSATAKENVASAVSPTADGEAAAAAAEPDSAASGDSDANPAEREASHPAPSE
jgi:hypothetical protein